MDIELYDCIPLAARITKATCEANQRRGNSGYKGGQLKIFACEGCPGVDGEPQVITVTEGDGMPKRLCKEPGCKKHQVVDGYCTEHADLRCPEKMDAKRKRCREVKGLPAEPRKYVRRAVPATPPPLADPLPEKFGEVVNAAGGPAVFGSSDLLLVVIRRLLAGVEARLLVDVSGMPDDAAIMHVTDAVRRMAKC